MRTLAFVALLLAVSAAAPAPPVAAEAALDEAQQHLDAGRYAEAAALAEARLAELETRPAADPLVLPRALGVLVRARLFGGRAGEAETLALAEREVAVRRRLQGPDHPDVGKALDAIGILFSMRGDPAQAAEWYGRALAVLEEALGPDAIELAPVLNHLSFSHTDRGEHEAARRLLERALAIQEAALGARSTEVAKTAVNLADLHDQRGDYAEARRLLERALSIWEEQPGTGGRYIERALHNVAVNDYRTGDYRAARENAQRALQLKREGLGPDHPSLGPTTNLLGVLANRQGDFAEARRLFERSVAIHAAAYGPDHPELAFPLANLAEQHAALGDHEEAERLLEQALAIREGSVGVENPMVALALDALASQKLAMGRRDEAEALFGRALALREEVLGPDHPDVAGNLDGLGDLHLESGETGRARELYERSLEIREGALGSAHPDLAHSLDRLARVHRRAGDTAAARAALERALRVREAAYGPSFPPVSETRVALARVLADSGEAERALDEALAGEAAALESLRVTSRSLPERQALLFAGSRPRGLDVALDLLAGNPLVRGSAPAAVDALIRGRAVVLDEMASRNEALLREDRLGPFVARLASARERLANLAVRGPADETPERYRTLLEEASREREQAERELAQRSLPFRQARERASAGLAEVAGALRDGDALLGYAAYGDPAAYLAYVLRPGWAPVIRPLGPASEVEALVREWREAVLFEARAAGRAPKLSLARQEREGAALRARIWDPLAPVLGGARRVHVVPDGVLHLVNLAALPAGAGRYLVETAPVLHVLSSERDLLAPPAAPGTGLLAVGAPDYDGASGSAADTRVAHRGEPFSCATGGFGVLEQSRTEAEEVASLWRRSGAGEDALVLRDGAATEAAFKGAAPGRRILHIATHGFFSGPECVDAPATAGSANPLLRAGLAFAGANRHREAGEAEDDGILTAEEVAALDLRGVEWAVLSACDTGAGDVQVGEGVLGLQRAFRVAGARNVILSLWPVEDRAGREWMTALYRHRLRDGRTTSDAVRRATLDVLEARRSSGRSSHPFYWAAFLATGPEAP